MRNSVSEELRLRVRKKICGHPGGILLQSVVRTDHHISSSESTVGLYHWITD